MARVLFVEDHSATRRICSGILRDHGYEVVEARNGRMALDLATRGPVDAVVTDWLLPDMDALQLLDRLVAQELSPPVIVYSNQPHLCPHRAHASRIEALIEKSEDLSALLSALDGICRRSEGSPHHRLPIRRHHTAHSQPLAPLFDLAETPEC